jgi:hypothetical protein
VSSSDHQDFDFSKDFLLIIDLFAAAYIKFCSSIAAAFKSFKLYLNDLNKRNQCILLVKEFLLKIAFSQLFSN